MAHQCIENHPCRGVVSIKLLCDFIEITLRRGCSSVNLLHIFRAPFTKNTSGWLLLYLSRRHFLFHKVIQGLLSSYLQTYHDAASEGAYLTRSITENKIKAIPARAKVFENSFFPYCIKEWSELNDKIRNIESINKFKVTIHNFIRTEGIFMITMELSYGVF